MLLFAKHWPDFVYKYMSASRAAQVLRDLQLYMAPNSVLNDLYDLNVTGFWQEDEESKFRVIAKRILAQRLADNFDDALTLGRKMSLDTVTKDYNDWLSGNVPIFDDIIHHSGVACFTSERNNQRMWGTYGVNHTGAVIEFHTDRNKWPMAHLLRSVIYTDQRLPICPSRLIEIENDTGSVRLAFEPLKILLCAKHMDWRDEMEWRLLMLSNSVAASGSRLIPFPRSAIAHVFIAPHITLQDEEAVRTAANGHNPPIPLIKRVPCREDQYEYYHGTEVITDYAQIQYWEKVHDREVNNAL